MVNPHTTRVLRIIDLVMKGSGFIPSSGPVRYFKLSWIPTVEITDTFCDNNCCCTLACTEGLFYIYVVYFPGEGGGGE